MDPLERMDGLLGELKEHQDRLALIAKDENISAHAVMAEVNDTVMSFLVDVASLAFQGQLDLRRYIHEEVEPAIVPAGEGGDPDGLMPEDADELSELLQGFRALLDASRTVDTPPGIDPEEVNKMKAASGVQIGRINAALERIEELRLEQQQEEDDDDDDDESDDESDDAPPAPVVELLPAPAPSADRAAKAPPEEEQPKP